ncbi:hypothetical protein CAPTEDRAFT_209964 [Capitella teleta]|uniref:Uncharacterized protein n=1 Tax=Capitella teleta TaxID=283909 RepID=R7UT00_CAPTE|nr:hypothetical protein CAPTEDRAFT_209964 [Capitella teleta]|eukprot:ELU09614.1 hypothetical protein CAPTEDRAFT_209964 [Capitella teleta]
MEIQKGCVATVSRYDSALHSNAAFSGSAEVIENASGSLSVNGSANPAISIEDCGDIESIEYRTHRNNNSIERQGNQSTSHYFNPSCRHEPSTDFDPVIKELVLRDCLPSCPYQLPSCLHRTPFQRECVPPELRFLQIPGEEFEAALRIIRESPRVRFFTPLNHKVLHLLILFVVFLVVWLIGFALWRLYPVLPPLTSAMLCLPVATLLVIIVSCLCGAWRHKVHFVCIDIAPCMSIVDENTAVACNAV